MKNRNLIAGWVTFLIAFIVYFLTAERTGSWWDCGEFLASDYKLQIAHQPGAPLYVMIYKVFMLLAAGNTPGLAFAANIGSAFVSALTIAFLFWTLCALCTRLLQNVYGWSAKSKAILIVVSGLTGSLAYAFSDTFWFSAVEAEVYALSSLFTAVTFWAIVRWQAQTTGPQNHPDRWILFIALLIGLSVGVHLLNLLCIPAIVFVAWGKYRRLDLKGSLAALTLSVVLLFVVLELFIPGVVSLAANFDLLAVNQLHFPFGSGVIVLAVILISAGILSHIYAVTAQKRILQVALLSVAFFYIGYSSFLQVIIRAHSGPPLNHTAASNPFSFYSYLTRQQYPSAPLLYGPYYDAGNPISSEKQGTLYRPKGSTYAISGESIKYTYNPDRSTFFPRIWETENSKGSIDFYRNWLGLAKDQKPTFAANLKFMFSYQMNHMFWRYFMWNFAGRQNDEVGYGDSRTGNWLSGVKPLDAWRLGSQEHLPQTILASKSYSRLYFLPFLLGLAGLIFQFKKDRSQFIILAVLFFFTGLAIILFINQSGPEPRERDYSFGGAFYTFAIWIGLGVPGLAAIFHRAWVVATKSLIKAQIRKPWLYAAVACSLLVPVLVISEEYSGHDRSGRTLVRDMASNYLNSCAPNSVLFTYADNDTYPLWYAQEVEGIRRDVRVVIQPFLASDWYVEQLHKKINDAEALPFQLSAAKYFGSQREYIPFLDSNLKGNTELSDVLEFIGSEDPASKVELNDGSKTNFLPTRNLKITKAMHGSESSAMVWTLPQNHLYKSDLAELDFIAANKWKRPVYFGAETPSTAYMGLDKYLHLEGLAYRLRPASPTQAKAHETQAQDQQTRQEADVENQTMYSNVMERFKWGSETKGEYLDPVSRQKLALLRQNCLELSSSLFKYGQKTKCFNVLNKVFSSTPDAWSKLDLTADSIGLCYTNMNAGSLYYQLNHIEKARERLNANKTYLTDQLDYVLAARLPSSDQAVKAALEVLRMQAQIAASNLDEKFAAGLQSVWERYNMRLI